VKIRFLIDENLSPDIKLALVRFDASIDVIRIGETNAPSFGTLDPAILIYLEQSQRLLVTNNRKSFPVHIQNHHNAGRHHCGIALVRRGTSRRRLIDELCLLWSAAEAEEWIDRVDWIPG
jgi:hypothetical protein